MEPSPPVPGGSGPPVAPRGLPQTQTPSLPRRQSAPVAPGRHPFISSGSQPGCRLTPTQAPGLPQRQASSTDIMTQVPSSAGLARIPRCRPIPVVPVLGWLPWAQDPAPSTQAHVSGPSPEAEAPVSPVSRPAPVDPGTRLGPVHPHQASHHWPRPQTCLPKPPAKSPPRNAP